MDETVVKVYLPWMVDRVNNYPSLEELADALVHNANGDPSHLAAYVAACNAIKAKYPKP